jgi:hypothetical protein
MLPSACSFIVDVSVLYLVVAVLHYMFRPIWPSSGVYDVLLLYLTYNLLNLFNLLNNTVQQDAKI